MEVEGKGDAQRMPPWILFWFGLDAVAALAPPLHWAAAGFPTPLWGLPATLFYFLAVGCFITLSIVAAYWAHAVLGRRAR